MPDVQTGPPEGRYGRSARAATGGGSDRGLRIVGAVLGVALLALIGWFGVSYVAGSDASGSLLTFEVVSDEAVEVRLEVHKDADVTAVCTLRAMEKKGGVVGRKDARIGGGEQRVDTVVTVRTTQRATSAELAGCQAAPEG